MYDSVRYVLLALFFIALFGTWLWSRRQAFAHKTLGQNLTAPFTVLQKRWLDKGTGICLVEAEDKMYLLAYTAGGGVSWQPVDKAKAEEESGANRLKGKSIFP